MPESRKSKELRERAKTHVLVGNATGFRIPDAPEEDRKRIERDLKALEDMGMVTFVSGVGWVDTMPAIIRFQRMMALGNTPAARGEDKPKNDEDTKPTFG